MSNKRKKISVRGSKDSQASTANVSVQGANLQDLADEKVCELADNDNVGKTHADTDSQQIEASSVTAADTRLNMSGDKQEALRRSRSAKSPCKCECGHMEAEHMPPDRLDRMCQHAECMCSNYRPVRMDDDTDTQQTTQEGDQATEESEGEWVHAYEETTVSQASDLIINDEYASLVPAISEQEYQSISQSIKDNGQWVPIIVNGQRIILDGHTRFKACKELEIAPRIMVREFEDSLQEKQFIIQINRDRRHLNDFQRIELEDKYQEIQSELAKKRMSEAGKIGAEKRWKGSRQIGVESISEDRVVQNYTTPSNAPKLAETKVKGRVIDISAKNAQVSPATYNKGRKIIKLAPSQELLNKLRTGKVRIDKVYRELENHKKRQDLISKGANFNVKFPDGVKLVGADFTKCKDIPGNSIDLIYTDPPYEYDSFPIYDELAKAAATLLKDGGILVTNYPQELRCQIIQSMKSRGLTWWWDIAIILKGPWSRMKFKKVIVTWKPLLLFVKGTKPKTFKFIEDSVESERPDKTLDRNIQ